MPRAVPAARPRELDPLEDRSDEPVDRLPRPCGSRSSGFMVDLNESIIELSPAEAIWPREPANPGISASRASGRPNIHDVYCPDSTVGCNR